ncbi:MAG: divergent PAP2 family protein [Candidatus Omnitrophica bacterium]|nr:divergent PAP2 family protein [Candidatus Omnitrophota bacterium]
MFSAIFKNKILMTTLSAWVIAQTLKVTIGVIREKKFDFRWFVGTGGMPSSHAAGAACLATAIGLEYGFSSVYFALAASFAIVVMFDAQGVRRATGRQARILNKITEDIYWQGRIKDGRLRELIGHTPIEVVVGALLGTIIALVFR